MSMIARLFAGLIAWLQGLFGPRPLRVQFIEGDELPATLPAGRLVVAREDATLWSAGMVCPCGCGRRLEVMLLEGVKPRWDLRLNPRGLPTLHPSVWVKDGCQSHFWLRDGLVQWCGPER
ncbi:DUF6527 family protein [Caulobacter sp.]|uniref:DUF6527 family protein n=1 Tax=Caulobacter sp. TaxID=78 RepID=UPI003BA9ECA6